MSSQEVKFSQEMPDVVVQLTEEMSRRGIRTVYFPDGKGALAYLLEQIPAGATVMTGGSKTLEEIGFLAAVQTGDYDYYRPKITAIDDNRERIKLRRQSTTADYYVGGVNAISLTGEILNVDGSGSRVAAYAYGAGKVFLVAGLNKIEPTLESALLRLRNRAAVEECRHLGKDTPCARTGLCSNYECYPPERQCGKLLIIEKESVPDRMTLVLVGQSLGF